MMVQRAARIERRAALRTLVPAREIGVDTELGAAGAAEHRGRVAPIARPRHERVIGECVVAVGARVVLATTTGADRDDVEQRVPVDAARLGIEIDAVHARGCLVRHVRKIAGTAGGAK